MSWCKRTTKTGEFLLTTDTRFTAGDYSFWNLLPGEGHTADNDHLVFKERILYGGLPHQRCRCWNLGFLGDANVNAYETTLKNVKQKCPDPNYIIVSPAIGKQQFITTFNKKLAQKAEAGKAVVNGVALFSCCRAESCKWFSVNTQLTVEQAFHQNTFIFKRKTIKQILTVLSFFCACCFACKTQAKKKITPPPETSTVTKLECTGEKFLLCRATNIQPKTVLPV